MKDHEIVIVNDNPEVNLEKDLAVYKNVILIQNNKNLGFGSAVHTGIMKAQNDFIVLLNDDVILHDESYNDALIYFKKDARLFAAGFAQKEKNGEIVGKNTIFWKRGLLFHKKNNTAKGITAWAEGGACMIDKEKYLMLGGFSHVYSPFYWEDIDLSYRAWKSGFSVLFDSHIVMTHHHESTIAAHFDKRFINTIAFRNQFLFIWKNITDGALIINHWLFLPFNLVYYLLKGRPEFIMGFLKALPYVLAMKKTAYPLSDAKVLDKFK